VRHQWLAEALRQNANAVLRSLAEPHHEGVHLEVEILHPEPERLCEPQPGAVKQARHQTRRAMQGCKHGAHLRTGEDDRQADRLASPFDLAQLPEGDLQHAPIEKQQGSQRLGLGGGGHPPLHGQVGQEGADFLRAHVPRMPLLVEEHVAADPAEVRLLGARAEVPQPCGLSHLVKQSRWSHGGCGGGSRDTDSGGRGARTLPRVEGARDGGKSLAWRSGRISRLSSGLDGGEAG
jgi:hypothetical protein